MTLITANVSPAQFVGTVWPSGDFSFGVRPRETIGELLFLDPMTAEVLDILKGHLPIPREFPQAFLDHIEAMAEWSMRQHREDLYVPLLGLLAELGDATAGMGLSDPSYLQKMLEPKPVANGFDSRSSESGLDVPRKRGLKGITSKGRKMLKSAAVILEEKVTKDCLTFLTVTLPSCEIPTYLLLTENYTRSIFELLQFVRYHVEKAGILWYCCFCHEIQPKRSERDGRPWLHSHILFPGRLPGEAWVLTPKQIQDEWNRILERKCGQEIQTRASANVQRVRKSAASYLGKYLSKGGESVGRFVAAGWGHCYPGQWWGGSRSLIGEVKRRITKFLGRIAYEAWSALPALSRAGVLYFRDVFLTPQPDLYPEAKLLIGSYGWLSDRSPGAVERFVELIL